MPSIFTIGHSTHPIEEFLALLSQHEILAVTDVRSYPTSKRWPHFNQEELQRALERIGIEYRWMKSLGGRRSSKHIDSPHVAWQIPAFRAYADYGDGDDFRAGLEELIGLAEQKRTAYMCSEGLWWRCHRRLMSDHLIVRGWTVMHIMPTGKLAAHTLPDFARIENGRLVYDVKTTAELFSGSPSLKGRG
jgi:uncharacterized protein (DUF488 family)